MGLCKCPKKKVTNLFCYEHRVNVCQNCMVKHHTKCIVQSYLQWLQDSDYNPNCILCGNKLHSDECIRLECLHIFHWKCLERKCRRLPSTTAPAGYKCFLCHESIFPLENAATPVAEQLRDKLSTVNWARMALGLPTVTENDNAPSDDESTPLLNSADSHVNKNTLNLTDSDNLVLYLDEPVYSRPEETAQMPRRAMSNLTNSRILLVDEDEKKDRKIYHPLSWLARWFRSIGSRIRYIGRGRYGTCKMIIFLIIIIGILCSILSVLGHIATDNDPAFDPFHNPHVHLNKMKN